MAKTYWMSCSVVLYANYFIEAGSEAEAIDKMVRLVNSDDFRNMHLIPDLDDPYQWGDALSEVKVECIGRGNIEDEPTLTSEQIKHYLKED